MNSTKPKEPLLEDIYWYALDKGWSTGGAKWLAGDLRNRESIAYLAIREGRSPDEVCDSILELAAKDEPEGGREP